MIRSEKKTRESMLERVAELTSCVKSREASIEVLKDRIQDKEVITSSPVETGNETAQ